MPQSLDITGFRCVNHRADRGIIAAAAFDADNPCTWCANRRHRGQTGPAFYYVEYGRWEFPFIAEANCDNFSLVVRPGAPPLDNAAWTAARTVQRYRNRIGEIGRQYHPNWLAFDPADTPRIGGQMPVAGKVNYPGGMPATDFYRQANDLRSELFALRTELQGASHRFRETSGIRDSKLDHWLEQHSKILGVVARQIDELESKRSPSVFAIVARSAIHGVLGGSAWDGLKGLAKLIADILRRR